MDSNRTQAGSSIRAAGDLTVKSDMRPNRCTRKQIQRSRVFYEMRRKFDALRVALRKSARRGNADANRRDFGESEAGA
ncbi:MAG: hypothetical protein DME55_00380 [Verrucomicrobia bacterium]|nr:MAG: hypothetical protein DME55_00380 [Verrucomicrobiota bacterium]